MVLHRIGIKSETIELTTHTFYIMRMSVSDTYHGMSAVKVKILVVVGIPNVASASANYFYII